MYQVTGTAQLPINTVYQLVAARDTPQFAAARTLLLIPELIGGHDHGLLELGVGLPCMFGACAMLDSADSDPGELLMM